MDQIAVIIGSIRPNRFADRATQWIVSRLQARDDMAVNILDLREYPLPMYAEAKSPVWAQRDYRTSDIERWGKAVDEADGYVIVSPEYNHGYSSVLKNALDYLFVEWNRKPVSFVSYGNVGGARCVEQLREVVAELEMAPLRHAVHILPDRMMAARSDPSVSNDELFAPLEPRADLLADELAWWTKTLAAGRRSGTN